MELDFTPAQLVTTITASPYFACSSTLEAGMLIPGAQYLQAQRLRRQFRQNMIVLVRSVDVVITPATPAPVPREHHG